MIDMTHVYYLEATLSTEHRLAGKAAVVTGGSRGIGAGIVRRLAAEGADVAFTFLTGKDEAAAVANDVRDLGRRAAAIEADLADPESAAGVVQAAAEELGKLDILVNNAGITFWAPLPRIPVDEFERVVAVDARAPFLMMQAAADTLSNGGRIVNISSAVTSTALAGSSLYSGVKAFLDQVTRVAAIEFAPRRITVNAVAPGTTATGRLADPTPEQRTQMGTSFTLGRIGEPADTAALVAFLASDEASFITGQVIYNNGGQLRPVGRAE
ncbi:MAG TPA: SDR family oxidoreductase [Streptosporangiaceae bacterium]|nr:SDR family oxidoreductase [Streptosporangiaceae bacterium]